MNPADFAAELRRRLDALPKDYAVGTNRVVAPRTDGHDVHWLSSEAFLNDLYAALTAAPPREEPPKATAGGFWCSLCHQIHSATSSACPGPPAPEDGTRDTGWVVAATKVGEPTMYWGSASNVRFPWTTSLDTANRYPTREQALEVGCGQPITVQVHRVVRGPGTRRWEQREEYTGMHICDCTGVIKYNVRPLISAPGPWVLDPEGAT